MIILINYVLIMIFLLLGVAFFTLLERKILGYIHYRIGPNKVGYLGLFQPFRDALKLFSKRIMKFKNLNYYIYIIRPCLGIFLIMLLWRIFPFWGGLFYSSYSLILFILISGLSVYFLLGTGWSRFSKYSLIGSYRSVAQAVSYEVSIFLILFCFSWFICSYSLSSFNINQYLFYYYLWAFPIIFIWILICLAETNRTPFDFSEGESELVSGFNTEYRGGFFSLIFIREYGSILFLRYISSLIFLGGSDFIILKTFFLVFLFIWIRGSYPRLRYDKLIIIAWKRVLPLMLGLLIFLFNYCIW